MNALGPSKSLEISKANMFSPYRPAVTSSWNIRQMSNKEIALPVYSLVYVNWPSEGRTESTIEFAVKAVDSVGQFRWWIQEVVFFQGLAHQRRSEGR